MYSLFHNLIEQLELIIIKITEMRKNYSYRLLDEYQMIEKDILNLILLFYKWNHCSENSFLCQFIKKDLRFHISLKMFS